MLAERPHPSPHLTPWQTAFRDGFAPLLSTAGLEALRLALLRDDPAVTQGVTTTLPDGADPDRSPPTAACPLGYAGWRGDELPTVAAVEA